jgi:plastocyanin
MKRRLLAVGLAVGLGATLGLAPAPASAGGGEFTTKAKIVDFAFSPKKIEIGQGTKVKWVNKGDENHTVTSNSGGLLDSETLAPGDTYTKKFKDTGVFKFHCEIHPDMKGKVISGDV